MPSPAEWIVEFVHSYRARGRRIKALERANAELARKLRVAEAEVLVAQQELFDYVTKDATQDAALLRGLDQLKQRVEVDLAVLYKLLESYPPSA